MKCSICKCELVVNGQARLETLDEHVSGSNFVSLKDKHVCSNPLCLSHKYECCWNDDGDFYGGIYKTIKPEFAHVPDADRKYEMWNFFHIRDEKKNVFVNDLTSAYGTHSRQMEVEISKTGQKDKTYLSPAWCLWLLRPAIDWHYKADLDGNVLKRSFKMIYLYRESGRKEYCIHYTPGIKMFFFCFKQLLKKYKHYKENHTVYSIKEMMKAFEYEKWDDRWWKTFATFVFRIMFLRTRLELKKESI